MRALNTTTSEHIEFSVVDFTTGNDWTMDAIGMSNDFKMNHDTGINEANGEACDWWVDYARTSEVANEMYSNLDSEQMLAVCSLYDACYTEFNDAPSLFIRCIRDIERND